MRAGLRPVAERARELGAEEGISARSETARRRRPRPRVEVPVMVRSRGARAGVHHREEHPEWVLHFPQEGKWGGIFKWSDPAATRYMTELIAGCIRDWGVDIYRNDRNTCPLPFWKQADTTRPPGHHGDPADRGNVRVLRRAAGEISQADDRQCQLARDRAGPGDDAAFAWFADPQRAHQRWARPPNPDQAHTLELSLWIPLDSNLLHAVDAYNFRSTMTTGVGIGLNLLSPYVPVDELRKGIAELKSVRPYWLGDYYPLTPANLDESAWAGWQFNRRNGGRVRRPVPPSEERAGFLQRTPARSGSAGQLRSHLRRTYAVKEQRVMTGAALAQLRVVISTVPGSMLIPVPENAGSASAGAVATSSRRPDLPSAIG